MQSELHVQEFMCLLNDNIIWMQVGYIMDNENDIKMSVILFQATENGNNVDMCNMKSFWTFLWDILYGNMDLSYHKTQIHIFYS